ncbi:MAG: AraC family transcriptional regulator [Nocardioidaceae bacterium]
MGTGADMFADFVEAVAASLDHDIGGDDLAAQLSFSRSHLDRVVKAVSGESAVRFRRRILLERAAYRLLTVDANILDIAVEAGYSSHEAFTRAFQRDFGRGPADWRALPGPPLLASPNAVHFHPPGALRVPALRKVTPMDLLVTMTEHHVWLVGELIERANPLDDEALDRLIEISVEGIDVNPTTRSLLSRLVGQLDQWNCSVANTPYDFTIEHQESLESMRSRLAVAGPAFLENVRGACETGALEDAFIDATAGRPEVFTYGQMIAHVLTYAAHRRTLVTGALYSAGITDISDDPLFWGPIMP